MAIASGVAALLLVAGGLWLGQRLDPPTRDELYARAEAAATAGKRSEAITHLSNLLAAAPQDAEALECLARLYEEAGQAGLAAARLRRLLALTDSGPGHDALRVRLARAQAQDRRPQDVLDTLAGLAEMGADLEVQLLRARALEQTARREEATQVLSALLAADPGYRPAIVGLARIETAAGQINRAAARLASAAPMLAEDTEYLWLDGELAYLQLDHGRSRTRYARLMALGAAGGPIPAELGLARAHLFLDELDAAIPMLDRLLRNRPDDPVISFFRALGALRQGDYRLAATLSGTVTVQYPNHGPAQLLAGAAGLALGELDRAEAYLSANDRADPEQDIGRRLLDMTRTLIGRRAKAELAGQPFRLALPTPEMVVELDRLFR